MKFGPQHFPNGTVVKLNDEFQKITQTNGLLTHTVTGLVRNGVKSYVFKTGVILEHTGEQGFNIDHVAQIVKRGSGKVTIDHGFYGVNKSKEHLIQLESGVLSTRHGDVGTKFPTGRHVTYSVSAALGLELAKLAPAGATIDYERMTAALVAQKFVVSVQEHVHFEHFVVNKKRLRKWVKTNLNRYLANLTKLNKADDALYGKDDWDYGDEGIDGYYGLPEDLNPNPKTPDAFLTNFNLDQLSLYKEAATIVNDPLFRVEDSGYGDTSNIGSLWYDGDPANGSTDRFWDVLDSLEYKRKV